MFKQDSFTPPQGVQSNARRGLELRRRWNRGGLSNSEASSQGIGSGVQRARNLSNGNGISLATIRQMRAFFERHERNNRPNQREDDGGPTAGTIAWLLWGGDAGRRWANSVLRREGADKMDKYENGGELFKADGSHRIVGGWFSVFKLNGKDVVDSDNEVIDIDSYREAAIDFAKNHRVANFDHEQGEEPRGTLIDNLVIDSEDFAKMLVHQITGIPVDEIPVQRLGHFGSFQVHDQADFDMIQSEGAMFSIEGRCARMEE